jgi:hypothetical protein
LSPWIKARALKHRANDEPAYSVLRIGREDLAKRFEARSGPGLKVAIGHRAVYVRY